MATFLLTVVLATIPLMQLVAAGVWLLKCRWYLKLSILTSFLESVRADSPTPIHIEHRFHRVFSHSIASEDSHSAYANPTADAQEQQFPGSKAGKPSSHLLFAELRVFFNQPLYIRYVAKFIAHSQCNGFAGLS